MQRIWTNPSFERSFIQPSIAKSELLEYMKLSISKDINNFKDILIFPNMEYKFTFYDTNFGTLRSIIALVTDVYEDQIKIKYVPDKKNDCIDCTHCKKPCNKKPLKPEPPMPTCNCVLNPPNTSKYDDPITYFIPIANLAQVEYIKNDDRPDDKEKGDVKVMILGISATMVKAIIVRLKFFDDSVEDAVKLVELAAGGVYDITYETPDKTIYEVRAKVVRIEEDEHHHTPCKPGKGFVRENIGAGNIVYNSYVDDKHGKDDFMKEPPVPIVKIIVDTSETFAGHYEAILLHSIRDCVMVQAPDGSEQVIPESDCCTSCKFKTQSCDKEDCGHYIPPKNYGCDCNTESPSKPYIYKFDNRFKATVRGENVELLIKGEKTDVTLESIIKYYLGVE